MLLNHKKGRDSSILEYHFYFVTPGVHCTHVLKGIFIDFFLAYLAIGTFGQLGPSGNWGIGIFGQLGPSAIGTFGQLEIIGSS